MIRKVASLRYWRDFAPVLLLAGLLVAQSHLFAWWLALGQEEYLVRGSMAVAALGVLLYIPGLFVGMRLRRWYMLAMSCMVSVLFVVQYLYYSYSGGFLQASALLYAGQALSIWETAAMLVTPRLLVFGVSVLAVLVMYFHPRVARHVHTRFSHVREGCVVGVLALGMVCGGYGYLFADEIKDNGNLTQLYRAQYNQDALVGKIGITNYFLQDVVKRAMRYGAVTEADKAVVRAWMASRDTSPRPMHFGIAEGRNIILVQVESLESAVIGARIRGGPEVTPVLNDLIKDGVYFSQYFANVAHGTTADAEFSTLNSLFPLPGGIVFIEYARNTFRALPALLAEHGYATAVMHGDVLTFWNRANIYPQLGYQYLFGRNDYVIERAVGFQDLGDESFFAQSISKLAALPRPFMATLMTLTSHTPFELPEDLQKLDIPDDYNVTWWVRNYLQSVHYTDAAIGRLIEDLKREGLYDTSVIVIFGDHGSFTPIADVFGVDRGYPQAMRTHHVPMLILAPGLLTPRVVETPASHVDLFPTLAHLLGIDPPASVMGQDMLESHDPVAVLRHSVSGVISAFMTSTLRYEAGEDGDFVSGRCEDIVKASEVDIEECREVYEAQQAKADVSDIMIRANMIPSR